MSSSTFKFSLSVPFLKIFSRMPILLFFLENPRELHFTSLRRENKIQSRSYKDPQKQPKPSHTHIIMNPGERIDKELDRKKNERNKIREMMLTEAITHI